MAIDMGISTVETGTGEPTFLASPDNVRQLKDIIILSGEGALTAGCVLGKVTASGKYKAYDPQESDGSETICGVLGCDVDATSGDVDAFMYVEGTFNVDKLTGYSVINAGSYQSGNLVFEEEH